LYEIKRTNNALAAILVRLIICCVRRMKGPSHAWRDCIEMQPVIIYRRGRKKKRYKSELEQGEWGYLAGIKGGTSFFPASGTGQ